MRISCVIPVFNCERYLSEALDSVLAQDYPLSEIIVVDDGSTDGTPAILQARADAIRVITQQNLGVSAARNAGIRAASGDAIAFLDSDDIWPAGRLKALVDAAERDAAADVTAGLVQMLDRRPAKPALKEDLGTKHRVHCVGSLLIRRSVFDRIGAFDEMLRVVEDTEFIMRARYGGIAFRMIDTVSLIYRLHEDNISRDIDRNQSATLDAMRSLLRRRREK
jgi:glycosyltransferase involved in cell wall biosynthesis